MVDKYVLDWAAIGGMASAVVAVLALGATLWQGFVTRNHNRLSVRPLLRLAHRFVTEHPEDGEECSNVTRYEIFLHNHGLGLATIKRITFHVDGKEAKSISDNAPAYQAHKQLFPSMTFPIQTLPTDSVGELIQMKADHNVMCYRFRSGNEECTKACRKVKDRLRLEVEYESLYGETFLCHYPEPARG